MILTVGLCLPFLSKWFHWSGVQNVANQRSACCVIGSYVREVNLDLFTTRNCFLSRNRGLGCSVLTFLFAEVLMLFYTGCLKTRTSLFKTTKRNTDLWLPESHFLSLHSTPRALTNTCGSIVSLLANSFATFSEQSKSDRLTLIQIFAKRRDFLKTLATLVPQVFFSTTHATVESCSTHKYPKIQVLENVIEKSRQIRSPKGKKDVLRRKKKNENCSSQAETDRNTIPHETSIRKGSTISVERKKSNDGGRYAPNSALLRAVSLRQAELPLPYQSFSGVTSVAKFYLLYSFLKSDEQLMLVEERVGGRLCSIRHMGAILFLSIRSNGDSLQVICQVSSSHKGDNPRKDHVFFGSGFTRDKIKSLKDALRVGDIIGAIGSPGRTKKGELSLYATQLEVVAPYVCADQATCPDLKGFTSLANHDLRYRYRFMDMMVNKETRGFFLQRHRVLRALRNFLDHQGFIEVETPILLDVPSGASAKPFKTYHEGNATTLSLRVAPELYLKQYIVGGLEKVYEIGRVFRNEDADRSHNPEFTTCELYSAFNTYQDLIPLTEDLFRRLAMAANGKTEITVRSVVSGGQDRITIDLARPFRRVSVYKAIEKAAGVKLPPANELQSPRGVAYLSAILLRYDIPFPPARTASKMFDKLIDFFIVDKVVEPIFIMDHPICMSPLAKAHNSPDKVGLAERFELFINGVEYCNAYSELNDPEEQFCRFQQQLIDRHCGDKEAMQIDETYLKALQVGMPPTAGWGLGIDRLVALLSDADSIRDVIFSPLLRSDHMSHDGKRRQKTAGFFSFSPVAISFVLRSVEEEMRRRGMPSYGCERVKELHKWLTKMNQEEVNHSEHENKFGIVDEEQELPNCRDNFTTLESKKLIHEVSKLIIRLFCGAGMR